MAVKRIFTDGEPVLRQRAKEIDPKELGSERFRQLVIDMIETMRQAKGVGIAAPQVGESIRLFIADSPDGPIALANPVFARRSRKMTKDEEGCLSLPGQFGTVKRHQAVSVEALTADGQSVKFEAKGYFARILQHEMDHLDGILFIDRVKEQSN
jgi:peptide deformylase